MRSILNLVYEALLFVRERRLWFLAPLIVLLILFSGAAVLVQGSVFAPLIYTLF